MTTGFQQTSFLASANSTFIEELYRRFLSDPASVDPQWARFFAQFGDQVGEVAKELEGASWAPSQTHVITNGAAEAPAAAPARGNGAALTTKTAAADIRAATLDSVRARMLMRAHRVRGHLYATLDPLGLEIPRSHEELDPGTYGFTEADYDRQIYVHSWLGREVVPLRDIVDGLRETYCGNIGVEFMHMTSPEQKFWIQERIEGIRNQTDFTDLGKRTILERLTEAESFERFIAIKHPGTKRFGLDGGEALIPALEQILKRGSQMGVEEVVIGMPHRGRLNVLAHLMNKPYEAIFSEFQGVAANPDYVQGSGDVKYHLGASADREFDDKQVHLSLVANPSHLEAVNPVVVGRVRAKQRQRGDRERRKVLGILMHGDAAFAGQGIVAETLGLSDIKGYRTGGTIHVVVNNQIGFTTNPGITRASRYPTDIAKAAEAPIFHVNGDDVEAVVHVARIATEFQHTFRKDVVIDMWCYRRFGHNEGDEPAFTQPLMYKAISAHPTTREIYARKLVDEGTLDDGGVAEIDAAVRARLDAAFEAAATYKPNKADWLEGRWSNITTAPSLEDRKGDTAVTPEKLQKVGKALTTGPETFNLNRKLTRFLDARRRMFETGEGLDWATAEALAFGTLLEEGTLVRISGQDSSRGTFSQRHSVFFDQETEEQYVPLANISPDQARFVSRDSPLSEAAVLGFEYGMALADPDSLYIWEAQFGDFSNGAQFIIDQFISSAESKWLRMCGLVMMLPHGYEGQGPEHSSARLERYLQLCAEDNWQVCNITSPANYFHALRRQVRRSFRKPLVIMTPKSLLRHKLCVSSLVDMGPGTSFRRVLPETAPLTDNEKVRRVVLCTGKVYYDLIAEREERGIDDIAVIRLEQIYPFPVRSLTAELIKYPQADLIWCQEEPRNMGAWTFVDRRLEALLSSLDVRANRPTYAGREDAASPATGSASKHASQQKALVDQALSID